MTTPPKHYARTLSYEELNEELNDALRDGQINCRAQDGLALFCYTRNTVYDKLWNPITLISRGLILDHDEKRVVATPFPKFFNLGETIGVGLAETIPDIPFETTEKVDGSLIIIYHARGQWRCSTKGSLDSSQAQWAQKKLASLDPSKLIIGTTYLCEAVYPENRIVVRHQDEALVLLAAFKEDGLELNHDELCGVANDVGFRVVRKFHYDHISELVAQKGVLSNQEEGFVVNFQNGLRLKIKGDEYCRVHALISDCTPLAMWRAFHAGDDLALIRRDLPEEFWGDFDQITSILDGQLHELYDRIVRAAEGVKHLSDRDVGLQLKELFPDPDVRDFIFPYRKHGNSLMVAERPRHNLFMRIRPTGNQLNGYQPSYAINRVADEDL